MKPDQKSTNVQSTPAFAKVPNASSAARKAWAVNFVVPTPQGMPSERLSARGDLVRKAAGCVGGGGY